MSNVRNALIAYRNEHNLTQQELSDIMGVKRSALSKWESGVNVPRNEMLKLIASTLNVTIDYLLGKDVTDSNDIDLAFYNQHNIVSDDEKALVKACIELINSKK